VSNEAHRGEFGTSLASISVYAEENKPMLRIRIEEDDQEVWMLLQGQIVGPEVDGLNQAWAELAPRLQDRRAVIDLRTVTGSDKAGEQMLGEIYAQTKATLLTRTPWSQYLALEIMYGREDGVLALAGE
jgi:hypothetical protein